MTATETKPMTPAEQRLAFRWIPPGSVEQSTPLGSTVYRYQSSARGKDRPAAVAYKGTSQKSSWHHSFFSEEQREKHIADWFAGLESWNQTLTERRAAKSAPHTVKVGDIIHHSWGWEQTQCDYYQVLTVTAHGATIQSIASESIAGSDTGGMSGRRMPVRDHFVRRCGSGPVEPPLKVRIDGTNTVTTLEHGHAGVWDGTPKYCSWYA